MKPKSGTLIGRLALRIGIGSLLATVLVATGGYWLTFTTFEERELAHLQDYVAERGRTESDLFQTAEESAEAFGTLFLEAYTNAPDNFSDGFQDFFRLGEDGAWRTPPSFYEGVWTEEGEYFERVTGFISNRQEVVTPDLQRRLVISLKLLARMGPGVPEGLVPHSTYPENAITVFSQVPWGLTAQADLNMTALSVVGSTLQPANPHRIGEWTNLYYDLTAEGWTVTYQLPVDLDGRHLTNASMDVHLSSLVERVLDAQMAGRQNMILAAEGALVAHPEKLDAVQEQNGQIDLDKLGDTVITEQYRLIRDSGPIQQNQVSIIEDSVHGAYLAVTQLHGPNWWWVTVYPKDLINQNAHRASRLIVAVGMTFLILAMAVVYGFLRRMVARPIGALTEASEVIGRGDYALVADGLIPLPHDQSTEIGRLAWAFRKMAGILRDTRELDDGLFFADSEGRILEANPAATRMTGHTADELLGITLFDLVTPEDAVRVRTTFRGLEEGSSASMIFDQLGGEQSDAPFEFSIRRFSTVEGPRYLATCRDITERRRTEEERLELERRLMAVKRYESLGQFAGGLAHDLNNILTTILGNVDLVREEVPADSPATTMLTEIATASDQASKLSLQLLSFAGKSPAVTQRISLSEVVHRAVTLAGPSVPTHIQLELELDPDLPAVEIDPLQFQQVTTNLITNAWEALGAQAGTVTVRTYRCSYSSEELVDNRTGATVPPGEFVTLEVLDTGPGFGEEVATNLFEPFFTTKFTGRGLGLSALLGITRSHGGAVLVEGDRNSGSRFRILLPLEAGA